MFRMLSCGCRELRSCFLPRLDPGSARIPREAASQSSAHTVLLHARARIPDCLELGNVDGLAARRVSVGFEERPATQRFCTRAASRRAGRDGGGDRAAATQHVAPARSEEHTSELQSRENLVCRLLLEKKKKIKKQNHHSNKKKKKKK